MAHMLTAIPAVTDLGVRERMVCEVAPETHAIPTALRTPMGKPDMPQALRNVGK
ncbi:hypothetical protein SAMN05443248_0637 [Bradyrhizobium erythrophlei]|jgi:hypothetical protein|uniref:Uncharacterized protein n=1 Tax=Bradyrhizobium erythrophlei TaxID=1437360 RepID=A0A1M5HU02_9BRAD|nr:hypothetical protein SAMN05443248_0637 [Bradyrhizobium erythrophlei]